MTDIILTVVIWGTAFAVVGYLLLFTIYTGSALFTWPPSIPTDGKTRRAMASFTASHLEGIEPPLILDLGSGFGHLAEQCARACPDARVHGFERFIVPYVGSQIRRAIRRFFRRKGHVTYTHGDFFKTAPIEDAAAIVCFLLDGPLMERTLAEIYPRMKPGVWLVCNGASLPGIEPDTSLKVNYIIGSRMIFGYRKRAGI